jgi:hypothetical protein
MLVNLAGRAVRAERREGEVRRIALAVTASRAKRRRAVRGSCAA